MKSPSTTTRTAFSKRAIVLTLLALPAAASADTYTTFVVTGTLPDQGSLNDEGYFNGTVTLDQPSGAGKYPFFSNVNILVTNEVKGTGTTGALLTAGLITGSDNCGDPSANVIFQSSSSNAYPNLNLWLASPSTNLQGYTGGEIIWEDCVSYYSYYSYYDAPARGTLTAAVTASDNNSAGKTLGKSGCHCGDPIDVATGNVFEETTDYTTAGANPLQFTRSYNSLPGTITSAVSLGGHWRSNYDRYVTVVAESTGNVAYVERPDGQILQFTQSGSSWVTDSDVDITLVNSGAAWTLTDSDDTVETYVDTTAGMTQLTSITARGGYKQTLAYNSSGQLASVSDMYGRTLSFSYTGPLLTSLATPDGTTFTYAYTASGQNGTTLDRLASVGYSTTPATSQTYKYEDAARPFALTGLIDEDGNRYSTWAYDSEGRGISSEHAGGAGLTSFTYNSDGTTTVTNPLGEQDTYTFTTLQSVPKVSEIDRAATSTTAAATRLFTYDANGYRASSTDWNGNTTTYTNNSRGLPLTITEAKGTSVARNTVFTWKTTLHVPASIATTGITTDFTYDTTGNPLSRTDSATGLKRVWSYTWKNAELLTATGPRSDVVQKTTLGYGTYGRLTSITNAAGQTTTIPSGTPGGLPTQIVDPNGVVTTLGYDQRLRLASSAVKTAAAIRTTSFTWDAAGNLTDVMLPDKSFTANTYDEAHRLVMSADIYGEAIKYTLDANGDRTATTIANSGGTTVWKDAGTYDALGRLILDQQGAGQTTATAYDNNGNPVTTKDPLSRLTTRTFDALNRLAKIVDPASGITKITYDSHDRITSVLAPNNAGTGYTYDGFGRLTRRVSPDTLTTIYTYDLADNLLQTTDGAGAVSNRSYDALDRPLTVTYPNDTAENVALTYDQAGHGFGIGRLTSLVDAVGSLSRIYDERGNELSEARKTGSLTLNTSYTYDAASRIASITYPSGTQVSYTHNRAGQVYGVSAAANGSKAAAIATNISYMPFGPVHGFAFGDGLSEDRSYDLDYRLTKLVSGTALSLAYGYNAADDVTAIKDALTPANSQTLSYDTLDHLNAASGAYGSFAWTYDGVGNRLSQTRGTTTTTYTYQAKSNVLTGFASGGQATSITTSGAGNITALVPGSGSATTQTFNQAERLSAVTIGNTQAGAYAYDAFGHRFSKTTSSGEALFLYDQAGHLLEKKDSADAGKTDTIYLNGVPIAAITSNATYFLHTDRLGTPQVATTTQKAVAWQSAYQPFGTNTGASGLFSQNIRFPGQYADAESGWYQNGFRDYNPALGRYMESDPIGLGGGLNIFAYADANPQRWTDPNGEFVPLLIGAAVFLAYELTPDAANAPGPCDHLVSSSPRAPLENAVSAATLGAGVGLGSASLKAVEGVAAEGIAGGAQSALAGPALAGQLSFESASSAFAADGTLSDGALAGAREIIPSSEIGNPAVPDGFSKFSTQTFQSPSGDFQVHFYMNPETSEPFYGLDYKSIFNSGRVGP